MRDVDGSFHKALGVVHLGVASHSQSLIHLQVGFMVVRHNKRALFYTSSNYGVQSGTRLVGDLLDPAIFGKAAAPVCKTLGTIAEAIRGS